MKFEDGLLVFGVSAILIMNAITLDDYARQIDDLNKQVEALTVVEEVVETVEIADLGEYKLTAYCPCVKCCGKSDGITATGVKATSNRTVAVDPNVIPLGSEIIIDGICYTAEDVGSAVKGNVIDIFFDTHEEALQFGVQYKNVKVVMG